MPADDWTGTRQAFADSANWFVRTAAHRPGRWDEVAVGLAMHRPLCMVIAVLVAFSGLRWRC